jgi:predicted DNA-binding transcriptional regulator AlpA
MNREHPMQAPTPLLDEITTADTLGCSVALLRKWRLYRQGPAYHKLGRLVRYSSTDLDAFVQSQRIETKRTEGHVL